MKKMHARTKRTTKLRPVHWPSIHHLTKRPFITTATDRTRQDGPYTFVAVADVSVDGIFARTIVQTRLTQAIVYIYRASVAGKTCQTFGHIHLQHVIRTILLANVDPDSVVNLDWSFKDLASEHVQGPL